MTRKKGGLEIDDKTAFFIRLISKWPDRIEAVREENLSDLGVIAVTKELQSEIGPVVRKIRSPGLREQADRYKQSLGKDALEGTYAISLNEGQKQQLFDELGRRGACLDEIHRKVLKTSITF